MHQGAASRLDRLCKCHRPRVVTINPIRVAALAQPFVAAGADLDAGGALAPRSFVARQRRRHRVAGDAIEGPRQHDGVLHCGAGALRHERHHRVAGVAEERGAALRPDGQRLADAERRLHHSGAGVEQRPRLGMEVRIGRAQLRHVARHRPGFMAPIVLRRGGEHELVAAEIEREGDDLARWRRAPPLGESAEVRDRQRRLGHHRPVSDHAGELRMLGSEQRGAHHRVDAVGADQRIRTVGVAVGEADRHVVGTGGDADGTLAGADDPLRQLRLERGEKVGAVDGELRRAVAFLGGVGHREPRGLLAGIPGAADAVGGTRGGGAHRLAHAETVERAHRIGREVDVGADAAEFRRLLEHHDIVALGP